MSGLAPYLVGSTVPELVAIPLRFQINGTSDPDFVLPAGVVSDVSRTDVGDFTITFQVNHRYPVLLGVHGAVMEATPENDLIVKCDIADYDSSAGTLALSIVGADGTPVDEEPVDDDWIFVVCYFLRRTTLGAAGAI